MEEDSDSEIENGNPTYIVSSESELSDEETMRGTIEISSESEPEVDCETWDENCKVINKTTSSLTGYHLMPTCTNDPELDRAKRQKICPQINDKLLDETFLNNFKNSWNTGNSLKEENTELITNPFKVCVINNFLENKSVLDKIRQEFYELSWNERNMDLYEFFQSKDLKYLTSEQIKNMYDFLNNDVMKWVSDLTGYKFTHISATCSLYSNTDYLLVHDDQREDRMVAFVLYLTGIDGWDESKGGALQLLSKDEQGQPASVVKDIFPSNNQFVFFPVTSDSYHQVAEVTNLDDCRLSINGWFHTEIPPVFDTPIFNPLETGLYSKAVIKAKEVEVDFLSWINEESLGMDSIQEIQQHIEENSEISLTNYFTKECFSQVLTDLDNEAVKWIKVGPPNRYNYEVLDTTNLPEFLNQFIQVFQSQQMFSLLQHYTDLELTNSTASMKFEFQKWTPGCYSLLTDYDWLEKNELDVIIYFGCKKASDIIGGRIQYVTIEDEIQNALVTLEPEENNLNIVYRDSARFTKYFSKQSKCKCFYVLVCSYSE